MKIQTYWFKQRMVDKAGSLRKFSAMMTEEDGRPFDPTKLIKMLDGTRRMHLGEAVQIGKLLGISLEEVLKKAGVAVCREVKKI